MPISARRPARRQTAVRRVPLDRARRHGRPSMLTHPVTPRVVRRPRLARSMRAI
ncbi:hypothetical protein D8O27_26040 [Burkholderia mallei]|uniref:Uncharacterized protein n=3 Tax=pseudomallei group TaxID=111527 RepID=A0AAX1X157_BURML|nr:hypothetical protein BMA2263 [Burkholderia mallei ATCC 23344]AYX05585.1 hypothetical protein EGY14_16780 [Burkholderia pseudomallei]RKN92891.1 hypothetical protein D8O31_26510 [Burkholderia mallei]AYX27165.1 hypothetical protein EGY16_02430 [Burkholderia pseudomallei]AYX35548.1 hypothetical protein EGY15_10610 [Burkholderia pseudomallei]